MSHELPVTTIATMHHMSHVSSVQLPTEISAFLYFMLITDVRDVSKCCCHRNALALPQRQPHVPEHNNRQTASLFARLVCCYFMSGIRSPECV